MSHLGDDRAAFESARLRAASKAGGTRLLSAWQAEMLRADDGAALIRARPTAALKPCYAGHGEPTARLARLEQPQLRCESWEGFASMRLSTRCLWAASVGTFSNKSRRRRASAGPRSCGLRLRERSRRGYPLLPCRACAARGQSEAAPQRSTPTARSWRLLCKPRAAGRQGGPSPLEPDRRGLKDRLYLTVRAVSSAQQMAGWRCPLLGAFEMAH